MAAIAAIFDLIFTKNNRFPANPFCRSTMQEKLQKIKYFLSYRANKQTHKHTNTQTHKHTPLINILVENVVFDK